MLYINDKEKILRLTYRGFNYLFHHFIKYKTGITNKEIFYDSIHIFFGEFRPGEISGIDKKEAIKYIHRFLNKTYKYIIDDVQKMILNEPDFYKGDNVNQRRKSMFTSILLVRDLGYISRIDGVLNDYIDYKSNKISFEEFVSKLFIRKDILLELIDIIYKHYIGVKEYFINNIIDCIFVILERSMVLYIDIFDGCYTFNKSLDKRFYIEKESINLRPDFINKIKEHYSKNSSTFCKI